MLVFEKEKSSAFFHCLSRLRLLFWSTLRLKEEVVLRLYGSAFDAFEKDSHSLADWNFVFVGKQKSSGSSYAMASGICLPSCF